MQFEPPPQAVILQVIHSYWLSRTVYLAARLKLADAVGDATTLDDLAKATGTRSDALRRLMRALTSHGYFREDEDGRFVQTPLSEVLRSGGSGSMRAIAEAELGHDHYQSWGEIESCLRNQGTAFERIYGKPIWQYYSENPETQALFGEAMTNFTAVANAGVLATYQVSPFNMAIDIGGGHGSFLSAILDQQPGPKASCSTYRPFLRTQQNQRPLAGTVASGLLAATFSKKSQPAAISTCSNWCCMIGTMKVALKS